LKEEKPKDPFLKEEVFVERYRQIHKTPIQAILEE